MNPKADKVNDFYSKKEKFGELSHRNWISEPLVRINWFFKKSVLYMKTSIFQINNYAQFF